MAHSSQLNSSLAARIPAELWPLVFSAETFIRTHDTTHAPTPEDDLFTGLRPDGVMNYCLRIDRIVMVTRPRSGTLARATGTA